MHTHQRYTPAQKLLKAHTMYQPITAPRLGGDCNYGNFALYICRSALAELHVEQEWPVN